MYAQIYTIWNVHAMMHAHHYYYFRDVFISVHQPLRVTYLNVRRRNLNRVSRSVTYAGE